MARTNAEVLWREAWKTVPRFGSYLWDFKGWREDRRFLKKDWDLCDECAQTYRPYALAWTRNDKRFYFWFGVGLAVLILIAIGAKTFG